MSTYRDEDKCAKDYDDCGGFDRACGDVWRDIAQREAALLTAVRQDRDEGEVAPVVCSEARAVAESIAALSPPDKLRFAADLLEARHVELALKVARNVCT